MSLSADSPKRFTTKGQKSNFIFDFDTNPKVNVVLYPTILYKKNTFYNKKYHLFFLHFSAKIKTNKK